MTPEEAESDIDLYGWIGTLGLKQIFLIFTVDYLKFHHKKMLYSMLLHGVDVK